MQINSNVQKIFKYNNDKKATVIPLAFPGLGKFCENLGQDPHIV